MSKSTTPVYYLKLHYSSHFGCGEGCRSMMIMQILWSQLPCFPTPPFVTHRYGYRLERMEKITDPLKRIELFKAPYTYDIRSGRSWVGVAKKQTK